MSEDQKKTPEQTKSEWNPESQEHKLAWKNAWEQTQLEAKVEGKEQLKELKSLRHQLLHNTNLVTKEIEELEGRADWTSRIKPLKKLGWLHQDVPPRKALLTYQGTCILPCSKVGFFVGEGGIGKSWALTQLAVAVATGVQWLGTFDVPQDSQGAVFMAMGEEDPEEMHRRIADVVEQLKLAAHQASALEALLWPLPLAGHILEFLDEGQRSLDHERFEEQLRQHAPPEGWKLIILDPASRFMGVDAEKDNAFATRFVQILERLTELPGNPTIICSHHTNKASRTTQGQSHRAGAIRGASALIDGARWQGNLSYLWPDGADEPDEARQIFTVTKSNYGPKPPSIELMRYPQSGVLWPIKNSSASFQPFQSSSSKRASHLSTFQSGDL